MLKGRIFSLFQPEAACFSALFLAGPRDQATLGVAGRAHARHGWPGVCFSDPTAGETAPRSIKTEAERAFEAFRWPEMEP